MSQHPEVITAICAGCLTRVDATELDNADRKCDVCREHKARAGSVPLDMAETESDIEPHPTAAVCLSFIDDREFDGGVDLPTCDEA